MSRKERALKRTIYKIVYMFIIFMNKYDGND